MPTPENWNFDADTVGQVPAGWTVELGTMVVANDQYVSAPNSLKASSGIGEANQAYAGAIRTDLILEAKMMTNGWGGSPPTPVGMLLFRRVNINNYYFLRALANTPTSAGTAELCKRVAGGLEIIASVPYTFEANVVYKVKVEMQGTQARAFINDVQVIPWTVMGTEFSSGNIGLRSYPDGGYYSWFDDVNVQDLGVAPQTWNLTIRSTTGGSTSPAPSTYSYNAGSTVTVQAVPDVDYILDHWELDGVSVSVANQVTVTMDTNHVLDAVFVALLPPPPPLTHTLTVDSIPIQGIPFTIGRVS